MLSQLSSVTPEHAHQILLWMAGIIMVGCTVAGVWISGMNYRYLRGRENKPAPREIMPQPLEVSEAQRFVTTEFCRNEHRHIVDEAVRGQQMTTSVDDDLQRFKSTMLAEMGQLNRRIDDLPNRIVALLKNTGAI